MIDHIELRLCISKVQIMGERIFITEYLSVLPSTEKPLSADVYFIRGKNHTYIVDVGSNEESMKEILDAGPQKIIITHFHEDHSDNLKRICIPEEDLYVGNYSAKVFGKGTVITEKTVIDDGVNITILPIPNSHAKGSLCVVVNSEYLIMGDAFYSNVKGYNVSLLSDEIRLLKSIDHRYVLLSHKSKIHDREEITGLLEKTYMLRKKDEPFIPIYDE